MQKIYDRVPSSRDALMVLMVCAFPIFIWSIIYTFFEIPAWLIRSTTWDLVGMIAYTQAFALFESLSIWLVFLIIGIILPARLYREKFVALSAIVIFTTTIWFLLIHFNDDQIREWSGRQFLIGIAIFGFSIISMYLLVFRFEKLAIFINRVCERLSILSAIYLLIGILSLIIVFIRNIF